MLPPWLLKTAILQALKPENRKKVGMIILFIITAIVLLATVMLLPLSFLTGGDELTDDFDITISAVYQEIYPIYEEYISDLLEKMNAKAEEVKEEHKRWVKTYSRNPETGEREESGGYWEYPDVEVVSPVPPLDALFAYLSQKNENILQAKQYEADKEEIYDFFNRIYVLKVTGSGMSYSVSADFQEAAEIAETLFPEDEASQGLFLQSIELIHQFMITAGGAGADLNLDSSAMETLNIIYHAFLEAGYSDAAAAGACGNIQQECNFNYLLSGSANGMIQWTGSRFRALEQYAQENGYESWQELDAQIGFMFQELSGGYKERLDKYASQYAEADTYKEISDPRLAAFVFCAVYEGCEYRPELGWGSATGSSSGPDGKRWQQLEYRQNYAEKIYNAFCGGGSSSLGPVANGSSAEKLAALFPSGLPNSSSAANRYMESIPIDIWDGSKKVTKSVTMHKALKEDLQDIFGDIANAHVKIISVSGYSWRGMNNGGSGSRSHHSYGVALDIDPEHNPSGKYTGNPVGVKPNVTYYYKYPWQPKTDALSIAPESVIVRAFESRGWVWGAKWGTVSNPSRGPYDPGYHDFMHFSFTGH